MDPLRTTEIGQETHGMPMDHEGPWCTHMIKGQCLLILGAALDLGQEQKKTVLPKLLQSVSNVPEFAVNSSDV